MTIKHLLMILCVSFPVLIAPLKIGQAAVLPGGVPGDEQTSLGYVASTGEILVDAPSSVDLTSFRVTSNAAIFVAAPATFLTLPPLGFDIDEDDVIFKSTIGSSFSSLSFGNVALSGLSQTFLLDDLEVTGSLNGGGDLGDVDLFYIVPEPVTVSLLLTVAVVLGSCARYRGTPTGGQEQHGTAVRLVFI